MKNENLLKKFLKKKVKFTESLLVLFLITGSLSFSSINFDNYTSTLAQLKNDEIRIAFDISEPGFDLTFKSLTETEYNDLKARGGVGFISYTDNILIPNYFTYSYNPTFTEKAYNPTLKENSYINMFIEGDDSNYTFKFDTIVNGEIKTKYYTIDQNTTSNINVATKAIRPSVVGSSLTSHFVTSTAQIGTYHGGAVYNSIQLGNITGDFIGNSGSKGGAIFNNSNGKIDNILGDFIANSGLGGAINTELGSIENITGNFIGNHHIGTSSNSGGGAISSHLGNLGSITGDFIGNYVFTNISSMIHGAGGAIHNTGEINNSTGNFIGNYVEGSSTFSVISLGGAIYNEGKINNLTGDFIGNYNKVISENNSISDSSGGAIYNTGEITNITGNFIGNYSESSSSKSFGGAIYNTGDMNEITGNFIGNYVKADLESISNGGAIYNTGNLTLFAEKSDIEFTGNYKVSSSGDEISNSIYNEGTINLLASSNNRIIFNDSISGNNEGIFNIGGTRANDSTIYNGTIILNNSMDEYVGTINFNDGTIEIGAGMLDNNSDGFTDFFGGNFVVGTVGITKSTATPVLNTMNSKVDKFDVTNWITNTELDMKIDIDVAAGVADTIEKVDGQDIHFSEINLINNTVENVAEFTASTIKVANSETGNYDNLSLANGTQIEVTEGIYDYTLNISDKDLKETGELSFEIHLVGLEPSTPLPPEEEDVIPPVNPTPPEEDSNTTPPSAPTSPPGATDYNDNVLQTTVALGGYASNISNIARRVLNNTRRHEFDNSVWIDTYGADENIKYSTAFGEKEFDNEIYSTTAGVDFSYDLLKGFDEKGTIFFGHYNGNQKYNSINIDQEGYYLGIGTELAKGNAYIDLNVMYGMTKIEEVGAKYDTSSLSFGIKIGQEFKVTDKIFIEPNVQFGYHMISSDDYTNKDGVRINTDTLEVYNISQELKASYKGDTMTPYMSFSYNINGYTNGELTATKGSVSTPLPMEIGIQSYFEGKIGVSKKLLNNNLNVYGEIIGTLKDNDSFGAQLGLEYKF